MRIETCLASPDERRRAMLADPIVPDPMLTVTQAITIGASPERVWPWLAQMGAGRAGWYSYDRIDNGGDPSARRIVPEYQHVAPGDVLPAIPGATDVFVAATVEPPRDLVLTVPSAGGCSRASWEYLLEPLDQRRTRLIVRARGRHDVSAWLLTVRGSATFSTMSPRARRPWTGARQRRHVHWLRIERAKEGHDG